MSSLFGANEFKKSLLKSFFDVLFELLLLLKISKFNLFGFIGLVLVFVFVFIFDLSSMHSLILYDVDELFLQIPSISAELVV